MAEWENASGLSSPPIEVPARQLEALDQDQLDRWFTVLGGALSFTCVLPGDDGGPPQAADLSWEAIPEKHDRRPGLERVLEEARRYDRRIRIRLEIEKAPMIAEFLTMLNVTKERVQLVPFFFGAALENRLSGMDYRLFESHFLGAKDAAATYRELLVLVADTGGRLRGPYLVILGEDRLEEAVGWLAVPASFDELGGARDLMRSECLWDDRPHLLTPDYFTLGPEGGGELEGCRTELARLGNELALPFLANWTTRAEAVRVARFEADRSVRVQVEAGATSRAAYELYEWTYGDRNTARARLEIVRRVVASRLPRGERSFAEFVASAGDLRAECELQLRMLVDQNLSASFEQRERIEKLVVDYIDAFTAQTASLSKEVVDNTYKTVGLFAGVAFAYLLKPDQGITVLAAGTVLYVVYVVFILLFYLRSLRGEEVAKWEEYQARQTELRQREVITPELEPRLAAVREKKEQLDRKFKTVRTIYSALIVGAIGFVILWWLLVGASQAEEAARRQALGQHASRLKQAGFLDVRAGVEGWTAPLTLLGRRGEAVLPDLTAIHPSDRRLLAVAWV
ncbi:MAG TPA: hypothetical protein VOA80_09105, partial [Thermoanaerobaculia bacterium]|nr:hypothetical protein [Thermoanaerobaculia bacterium]